MTGDVLSNSAAVRQDRRGGHRVIDFVNTVAWRGDPAQTIDVLADFADLVAWAHRVELLSRSEAESLLTRTDDETAGAVLRRGKALRESLHRVLIRPECCGDQLDAISAGFRAMVQGRRLQVVHAQVQWIEQPVTAETIVHRLHAIVVDFLTAEGITHVKSCADGACGWLFLDRSRRGNRRWCSSADCGNRARVRRHYQRTNG